MMTAADERITIGMITHYADGLADCCRLIRSETEGGCDICPMQQPSKYSTPRCVYADLLTPDMAANRILQDIAYQAIYDPDPFVEDIDQDEMIEETIRKWKSWREI